MTATQDIQGAPTPKATDPAKEMLLRNTMDVLRAFSECSDDIQAGVLEMTEIIADPATDEDARAAAEVTLIEALYPQYVGEDLGIDSDDYEITTRNHHPEIEAALDEEENVFATNLSRLMAEKNITQKELAEKIGVGQPAIANMISRQCRPQRRTIEKISVALGVDPKTLWPFVA